MMMDGLNVFGAGARSTMHIFGTAEGAFRHNVCVLYCGFT